MLSYDRSMMATVQRACLRALLGQSIEKTSHHLRLVIDVPYLEIFGSAISGSLEFRISMNHASGDKPSVHVLKVIDERRLYVLVRACTWAAMSK